MMDEFLTIAEASRLIAEKQLSPVELTAACLDRARQQDDMLHAFILPTPERAMADAHAAEARVMAGLSRGPLDGIPIGHKDIYNTAGIRTTGAFAICWNITCRTRDATTVRKWAEAGTVLMGKFSTHEFALGGPSFDLPWPPARNPWNPEHFTAGSSSGTGAAVAAGFILGGTGSDTGGSIRGPAALCGIAGIKPTYGRASRAGMLPLSFSWIMPDRWHGPCEIARCCCRRWPATIRPIPASADRPVPDFTADIGKGREGPAHRRGAALLRDR